MMLYWIIWGLGIWIGLVWAIILFFQGANQKKYRDWDQGK